MTIDLCIDISKNFGFDTMGSHWIIWVIGIDPIPGEGIEHPPYHKLALGCSKWPQTIPNFNVHIYSTPPGIGKLISNHHRSVH